VPATSLPELASAFPSIGRVARAKLRDLELDTSVPTIGASSWTNNGYSGGSVKVAVVDTGIDSSPVAHHVGNVAVVTAQTVKLSIAAANASDFGDNSASTDDLHGHGSHCAGSWRATRHLQGRRARLLAAEREVLLQDDDGGGSAYDADIIAATDWAITQGATC